MKLFLLAVYAFVIGNLGLYGTGKDAKQLVADAEAKAGGEVRAAAQGTAEVQGECTKKTQ
jgi:hypothetical protein